MKSQIIEVTLPRYQHIKLSFIVLAHWKNGQQIGTYIYSNTLFCLVIVLSLQFCVFSSETTNTNRYSIWFNDLLYSRLVTVTITPLKWSSFLFDLFHIISVMAFKCQTFDSKPKGNW